MNKRISLTTIDEVLCLYIQLTLFQFLQQTKFNNINFTAHIETNTHSIAGLHYLLNIFSTVILFTYSAAVELVFQPLMIYFKLKLSTYIIYCYWKSQPLEKKIGGIPDTLLVWE